MCGFQGTKRPEEIPVVMAKGSHLFPYRTQKLSLSAPMVLGWRRPGRVGHCRIPYEKSSALAGLFSYPIDNVLLSGCPSECATSYLARFSTGGIRGTEACRRQWRNSEAERRESQGAAVRRDYASSPWHERRQWRRSRVRPVDAMSEAERGKPQGAMGHCDYVGFPDRNTA